MSIIKVFEFYLKYIIFCLSIFVKKKYHSKVNDRACVYNSKLVKGEAGVAALVYIDNECSVVSLFIIKLLPNQPFSLMVEIDFYIRRVIYVSVGVILYYVILLYSF